MESAELERHGEAARIGTSLLRLLSTFWRQISREVALEAEQRHGGCKQACCVQVRSASRPAEPSRHWPSRFLANDHFDRSRSAPPATQSVEPRHQPKAVSCCLQWKEVLWLWHHWKACLVGLSAGIQEGLSSR